MYTQRWPNVRLMLAHRLRRWPNISPTLVQRLVFAEWTPIRQSVTQIRDTLPLKTEIFV